MEKRQAGIFPPKDHRFWKYVILNLDVISEIRLRVGKPILISVNHREVSLDEEGNLIYVPEKGKRVTYSQLQELIDFWCMDSRYAFQEEIKKGYMTIQGGHRIGICGETVTDACGSVTTIKYISAVNIRVAHEVKNAAENIMPFLYPDGQLKNTLIISPPGAGKTTLLRDIVRRLADGDSKHKGKNVGIVDERSEIAACFQGIPQLDVGLRSDVLDSCRKVTGMQMLLRSMSPEVMAVDELGSAEEAAMIRTMCGSGCSVLATIHGSSIKEIREKPILRRIWEEEVFENILVLDRDRQQYHITFYRGKEEKPCYTC